MKREILFRGKRVDNGEWIYGAYLHVPEIPTIQNEIICFEYLREGNYGVGDCRISVIPETVGQFTGLLDKNGKKIFENDVVMFLDDDILTGNEIKASGIVYFDDSEFTISQIDGVKESYCNSFCGPDGREFSWNELEIIGNVFNNPELVVKNA